jgi:D-lactate dehydrogenase
MKVAVFSTKSYDRAFLDTANQGQHELYYYEARLEPSTAALATGCPAVCIFVNDDASPETLRVLAANGTRLIALRCTGFNNVNLAVAAELGMRVVRVTVYSPYSVAEHAVALIQALNRKIHRAYNRVREGNFSLDGLVGFDLYGKTVGVLGTGKIGRIFGQIMKGFGCTILGYDVYPAPEFEAMGGRYVELPELFASSDIISVHVPLLPTTRHIINEEAIAQMKPGVVLINPSRGALVDTEAVIEGLKSKKIGALGMDVYEHEEDLFFEDLSSEIIDDDMIGRLLMFPNVIITGHQAFLTNEAQSQIAQTTIESITDFEQNSPLKNELKPPEKAPAGTPA